MLKTMKYFTVERKSFLIWRFIQFWIFFIIFILEIIQLFGYSKYYWHYPANDQIRSWITEGISFAIIGYILAKFNRHWETEQTRNDVILDWILLIIWNLQCFLNISPAIFGLGLDCNIATSPYNINTYEEQARCRLFLSSTILSFVALFTTFVTLVLSIVRWKNRQLIPSSSISSYNMRKKSYLVQEGSLDSGEPVLLFYSKNKPVHSIRGKLVRNSNAKITRTSTISSPINISISEPEIAAAAIYSSSRNYSSRNIPNVNVYDEEKNENELKY